MIVRATIVTPIPSLLVSGSALRAIALTEMMATMPASRYSNTPARRAARSVLIFKREVN
jgi:hypothetical protein